MVTRKLPLCPSCGAHTALQSTKEADARALLKLLSPTGTLFTAMYSADADGSTQFFFPKERLPTHTQVSMVAGLVAVRAVSPCLCSPAD